MQVVTAVYTLTGQVKSMPVGKVQYEAIEQKWIVLFSRSYFVLKATKDMRKSSLVKRTVMHSLAKWNSAQKWCADDSWLKRLVFDCQAFQ